MTKQDYIKLAKLINKHVIYNKAFMDDLCEILKSDNPHFNKETFRKACEY
jgi:hypothetical protein